MNGFLVVARCAMDDVPLRLLAGVKEARDYAATVTAWHVAQAADAVLGGWCDSQVIRLEIVEFRDGAPARVLPARRALAA